jgi:hypothetical protein
LPLCRADALFAAAAVKAVFRTVLPLFLLFVVAVAVSRGAAIGNSHGRKPVVRFPIAICFFCFFFFTPLP